jgi:hypothetical protein
MPTQEIRKMAWIAFASAAAEAIVPDCRDQEGDFMSAKRQAHEAAFFADKLLAEFDERFNTDPE